MTNIHIHLFFYFIYVLSQTLLWIQIALFKEKQRGILGFTDHVGGSGGSSGSGGREILPVDVDGVSTQWLHGTAAAARRRDPTSRPQGTQSEPSRYSTPHVHEHYQDDERVAYNEIVQSGHYSAEALQAVGLGLSPGSKLPSAPSSGAESERVPQPPPSPVSIASASDLISLRVTRAWGLPECLTALNIYVVVDWGKYGKSSTQRVQNSSEPHFGATLQFRSPYRALEAHEREEILSDPHNQVLCTHSGAELLSTAGPMKFYVFNRNESVSDELLASGELDLHENILTTDPGEPSIVYLADNFSQPSGCVEYIVKHMLF